MSLKTRYREAIQPKLLKDLSFTNMHQVPKVVKVTVNRGLGEAAQNAKSLEASITEIGTITGQKPVVTRAKRANAAFKLRAGMAIGCKVTLRRERMYEFLDRLVTVALPRVRDFRGLNGKSFDGRGNYAMGVKEQIVFPEIDYDQVDEVRGMDIIVVTSARTDDEARELLANFEFPFVKA